MSNSEQLIVYCGLFCKECKSFISGKCDGCRGDSAKCATGYKKCLVKPCCVENVLFTCADCTKYTSPKNCAKYNPLLLKFVSLLQGIGCGKGIETIKEKSLAEFLTYMADKKWVIFKTKDTFFNKKLSRKTNNILKKKLLDFAAILR